MNVKGTTLALRSLLGLPHHIASAYFCILFICFVLFFSCWWSKLKPKTLWRFSTWRKKMKNATIYWPQGQWGGVRAHYCATATLSAATLSTMREMMYFTRTKRRYFWFAQPPTPKSPRQDRFKVLPTLGPKWLDLFLWLPGGSNRSN